MNNRPPTVVLRSGWQTVNIGDIGHTPGTLRYMQQHLPEAEQVLWLVSTNDDVTAMLQRRFPRVRIVRGGLEDDVVQAELKRASFFLNNSGMHFTRWWPSSRTLMERIADMGIPFGFYGQSFDGFQPGEQEPALKLFERASFIFTRENESLAFLRSIGAKPRVLEFGPDGCFGNDCRDDDTAAAYLRSVGLTPGAYVCVVLRTNSPHLDPKKAESLLNPRNPTPEHLAENERWGERLRSVITAWVRQAGLKVLLSPEVDKEMDQARKLLLDRLPADVRDNVVHRTPFWTMAEATSVYANAVALVAMEPHSPILALGQGTPSIHYCAHKHGVKGWMFRDIGLSEWLYDIEADPADRVTDALLRIHHDRDLAKRKVARAMRFVHERSGEMMREIRRTIGLPL